MAKAVSFRADEGLLERVAVECVRRGCSKTDAFGAALELWLGDGLAEKSQARSSSAERVVAVQRSVPLVRPAASFVRPSHAQTCKCPVCEAA